MNKNYISMLQKIRNNTDITLIESVICEKVLNRLYIDGDIYNIIKLQDYDMVMYIANDVLQDYEFQYVLEETIGSCIVEKLSVFNNNLNNRDIDNKL